MFHIVMYFVGFTDKPWVLQINNEMLSRKCTVLADFGHYLSNCANVSNQHVKDREICLQGNQQSYHNKLILEAAHRVSYFWFLCLSAWLWSAVANFQ